jgi:hypothetical protein
LINKSDKNIHNSKNLAIISKIMLYITLRLSNTMKTRTKLTIIASFAGVAITGMMLAANVLFPGVAFAASSTSTTANHFGQGASQLGKSGQMGDHASSFPTPRLGIGNVGQALCNEKLKPGQLADVLNGGSCP